MKRPVYIIHGWAYSIDKWKATVDQLRSDGFEIVQLHVPGLTSESDHSWTIDEYVEWLDSELRGVKKPIVLGHSNGGRIALHYAVTYPKKLGHLILLNSAGIETAPRRLSLKRRVITKLARLFRPLRRVPLFKKVVYRLLGSDYGAAPEHMKKTLANMLASDKGFDASPITTQTSIIWGEEDTTTPVAMGKKLHEQIKGSSIVIVPEWRHAPYATHPDQLADEIKRTIRSLP